MAILKKFFSTFKRYRQHFPLVLQRKYFKCVTLPPMTKFLRGRVLISYALSSAGLPEDHPVFAYHSGPWESNIIIRLFRQYGYTVDCIHYTDNQFVPEETYDVIFAINGDLLRLAAYAPGRHSIKIFHPCSSSVAYQNAAEMDRIHGLEKRRRGALYMPKRQEAYERIENKVLEIADYCVLTGSTKTLDTYPSEFHHKITTITVSASPLSFIKNKNDFVPPQKEFLWFFGRGAVHKGLDLLLEVFAKNEQWVLNIVGLVKREPDFMRIYHRELNEQPNIRLHGYLNPSSTAFIEIAKRSFCFIAPSCSESISTACATMMQLGLYPLVSTDTGIELPDGCGMYLDPCTLDTIEAKVRQVYEMTNADLEQQITKTQTFALREYSREKFARDMDQFLSRVLKKQKSSQ
jgi:glycosyltransferase involved in cell wall biosynthesis